MKIVTTITDPNSPNFGQVIETDIPDVFVVPKWDAYDFKMRFTAQERKDIRAAAQVNADVEDFVDLLDTAAMTGTLIHADNPLVIAALDAMTPSILAVGRSAEILSL